MSVQVGVSVWRVWHKSYRQRHDRDRRHIRRRVAIPHTDDGRIRGGGDDGHTEKCSAGRAGDRRTETQEGWGLSTV